MTEELDYSAFATASTPTTAELQELTTLAQEMVAAQGEVEEAEAALKRANERLSKVAEHQIPELMARIGMEKFVLTGGVELSIKKGVRASIPQANKERAMAWLEDHGHGGLIKRQVSVAFTREQEKKALALVAKLSKTFPNVRQDRKVEPSTLTAFINEQLRQGAEFPMELFGAWEHRTAKLKVK